MNGQASSLLAFKLKKLMVEADKGIDVSEAVRNLLSGERKLAGDNAERLTTKAQILAATFARLHAI